MTPKEYIKAYTRGCSNELVSVEDRYGKKVISYHEWLTPENALAAVELAREEMKKIVKKYEAQGNRCKAQSIDNNETDNSYFWDGFENCAENILRDLQRKE